MSRPAADQHIVQSIRRNVILWFLLVTSLVSLAGWVAYTRLREQTIEWARERRDLQLRNLASDLETADGLYTTLVHASDRLLRDTTQATGKPNLGAGTVVVGQETVPDLRFGERAVANHFETVDTVTEVMGGTATLFVKSGERFIRVATNVKTATGTRAVGTQLDPNGRAIAAIRQDKVFTGVVDILGKSYFTLYEPIHGPDGATIGIWYVGYQIETLAQLGKIISNLSILENGWVALLDAKGHPLFQSAHLRPPVVGEVAAILGNPANLAHPEGFKDQDVATKRFEAWGFTLVGGIYRPDVHRQVVSIFAESLGLLACVVLLVLLASYIAARRYSAVLLRVASLTEIEALKNQADEARHAAEQASRTKSAFLANMSHELRTPMNAIIGYSEMLIEEARDTGQEDLVPDLESIQSAGRHLLSLINDILDLSKIEAGKMELFVETFSLPALLDEVRTTIDPLSAKNGNTLTVQVDPALGAMRSDQTKVRQTLLNLLSNACKFTKNGSVTC